jgi:hypothetical protein
VDLLTVLFRFILFIIAHARRVCVFCGVTSVFDISVCRQCFLSFSMHTYILTEWVYLGEFKYSSQLRFQPLDIVNSLPLQSVTSIKSLISDQIWFCYTQSLSLHLAAYYTCICTSHGAVWGSGGTNPLVLNPSSNECEWSASSTSWFKLEIQWLRECAVQSRSEGFGKDKNFSLCLSAGNRTKIPWPSGPQSSLYPGSHPFRG